jgi:hypothetical protein
MILPSVVKVRSDAADRLRAARGDPEGDDLVEDQESPGAIADRPEAGEHLGRRGAYATRALDRLDHDRREIPFPTGERPRTALEILPGQADDEIADGVGDARGARHRGVVGPVVGPFEPRDQRPAGERPGRPHREHRGLGARIREANPLDRFDPTGELLGEGDLQLARRTERGSPTDLLLDGRDNPRVGMAQDQRRVVAKEVAVRVPVDVLDANTRAAGEIRRIWRREHGRPGRATGHDPDRTLEQRRRSRCPGAIRIVKCGAGDRFGDGHARIVPRGGGGPGPGRRWCPIGG